MNFKRALKKLDNIDLSGLVYRTKATSFEEWKLALKEADLRNTRLYNTVFYGIKLNIMSVKEAADMVRAEYIHMPIRLSTLKEENMSDAYAFLMAGITDIYCKEDMDALIYFASVYGAVAPTSHPRQMFKGFLKTCEYKKPSVLKEKVQVVCVETGVVFASTREAERATGANHSHIAKVCRGKRKTAGGFTWRYVK